jgi:hypothetical protein
MPGRRLEEAMTHQESLCDYAAGQDPEKADQAAREETRRKSIRRLRSGGHWLTLLQVARTIPQPFTLNDISVAVWRARPEVFGMRGYPYPDNHKVHYILYGTRGLIAKGIIRRIREGLFSLPDEADVEAIFRGAEVVDSSPKQEGNVEGASEGA